MFFVFIAQVNTSVNASSDEVPLFIYGVLSIIDLLGISINACIIWKKD